MDRLVIKGGNKLLGDVNISGAKNSILPILAATVLCEEKCVLHNCPELTDVKASVEILKTLGKNVEFSCGRVNITEGNQKNYYIPENLMRKMRCSVVFAGALLGKVGRAVISLPGGCELGPRPIDIHISAFKSLGAAVRETGGKIYISANGGLTGAEINLSFQSVGATENTILAAVTANGTTIINNAAREPEICDLANFLNKCGAKITGAGTNTVKIEGVKSLSGANHTVISDRIEAATFISFAVVTGGNITLKNVNYEHLTAVIDTYRKMGVSINCSNCEINVSAKELKAISFLKSGVYPLFPTDAGPMYIAALLKSSGTGVYKETIFQNRFGFVPELNRMGANIKTDGKIAIIEESNLFGADCVCTDLRGGAAILTAALSAKGITKLEKTQYIYRGYENLVEKLKLLGADIYTEEV